MNRDGSVVVGFSESAAGDEAFRWTSTGGMQGLGDLPGGRFLGQGFFSQARDVSDDGAVVVGTSESANGIEAFLWSEATGMIGLGDLPGGEFYSHAEVVSADGSRVYGTSEVEPGPGGPADANRAFVWDAVRGMRDLEQVLTSEYGLDLGGWKLRGVTGVSADGLTIVGAGDNPAGQPESFVVFVPEPDSSCLALCAAPAGLLRHRRRRQRSDH